MRSRDTFASRIRTLVVGEGDPNSGEDRSDELALFFSFLSCSSPPALLLGGMESGAGMRLGFGGLCTGFERSALVLIRAGDRPAASWFRTETSCACASGDSSARGGPLRGWLAMGGRVDRSMLCIYLIDTDSSRRESPSATSCVATLFRLFGNGNVSAPPQHRTKDLAHALSLRGQVTCSQLQSRKYQRLETYILPERKTSQGKPLSLLMRPRGFRGGD